MFMSKIKSIKLLLLIKLLRVAACGGMYEVSILFLKSVAG